MLEQGDNDSDNDHANGHNGRSGHKHRLSAKLVEEEDGWDGHDKVDDTNDTGCKKGNCGASETDRLEDLGSIVDQSVDTDELLEEHDSTSKEKTKEHSLAEEIHVSHDVHHDFALGALVDVLWVHVSLYLTFELDASLDFTPFFHNKRMVDR